LIDIANEVGVSRGAVGRVLLGSGSNIGVSDETASRIREVAARLNYQPNQVAQQLSGKSSRLIGALISEAVISTGRAERLLAFEAVASQRGYRVLVGQSELKSEDLEAYLDDFATRGVETVVYLDTSDAIVEQLADIPNLISSVRLPGRDICFVQMDRAAASRMAVDHLVERGRKRIGLAEVARMPGHVVLEEDKRTGYLKALRAHGLEDGTQRIAVIASEQLSGPAGDKSVRQAIHELVFEKDCDAIIFTRDWWAALGIKELRRRGLKVPQDVAVVGFDNREFATLIEPELTAIDHRHTQCAQAMMDIILRRSAGQTIPKKDLAVLVEPQLVIRQSS
jgi:DNA-binding LacI/PurR family transcriptional regulator